MDLEKKFFATDSSNLVLDFTGLYDWTFNTGDNCTFKTGHNCTFKTGSDCTFKTGWNCTFDTVGDCTFRTGGDCTFDTGNSCTFSLYNIDTCKFKRYNNEGSIILDRKGNEAYKLTKEFLALHKIKNG